MARDVIITVDGLRVTNTAPDAMFADRSIGDKLDAKFDDFMLAVRAIAERAGEQLSDIQVMPSEVVLEFGLTLATEAGAPLFAHIGAEGSVSVSLTWSAQQGA